MMTTERTVQERDFRNPEYRDADPKDYEFRQDGTIARKDRWETGMRRVAGMAGFEGRDKWEIQDVLDKLLILLKGRTDED